MAPCLNTEAAVVKLSGQRERPGPDQFWANVAVGLLCSALFHASFIQQNSAIQAAREAIITWQMDRLSGIDESAELAWIDINQTTRRAWGGQDQTPRDEVKKLIAFAITGDPAVVVVDVDLSLPQRGYESSDAALASYLAWYEKHGPVPLILVRRLTSSSFYYAGRDQRAMSVSPSFLDDRLGTSPARPFQPGMIEWGTAGMDRDPDGVERRWRLWENSCDVPGQAVVVPSVILLAAAAKIGTPRSAVSQALQPHALACTANPLGGRSSAPQSTKLRLGRSTLYLTESGLARRLFYRYPWSLEEERSVGLDMLSANNTDAKPLLLKGRVAVIGSSDNDLEPWRPTPVGLMPGALVLVNAIGDLLSGREFQEPVIAEIIVSDILLVFIVAGIFQFVDLRGWSPFWAFAGSLALVMFLALTLGLYLFNLGIWIDSVIPVFGIFASDVIGRTLRRVAQARRRF